MTPVRPAPGRLGRIALAAAMVAGCGGPDEAVVTDAPAAPGALDVSGCPDADGEAGARAALCNGDNVVELMSGLVWSSIDRSEVNPLAPELIWSAGLGVRMGLPAVLASGRHVTYVDALGEPRLYVSADDSGFIQPPDSPGRLRALARGYELTTPGRGTRVFSERVGDLWLLTEERSVDGGRTRYERDDDGRLLRVRTQRDTLTYAWEGELLRTVSASDPETRLELRHDERGALVELSRFVRGTLAEHLTLDYETLPDGTLAVGASRLEAAGEPEPITRELRYGYGAAARLGTVIGPGPGDVLTITRARNGDDRGTVTLVRLSSAEGAVTELRTFDSAGRLLATATGPRPDTELEYDARGYLARVTTADGQTTALTHDRSTGLLTRIDRSARGEPVSETRFEHQDQMPVSAVTRTAAGSTIASQYDEATGALRRSARGGFVTEYDEAGRPVRQIYRDQELRAWEYGVGPGGRRLVYEQDLSDVVPRTRIYRYDDEGGVVPVEDDGTAVLAEQPAVQVQAAVGG